MLIKRNWKDCPATVTHGRLIERPIFTQANKSDNLPSQGAVLTHIKYFSRAYLEPKVSTISTIHEFEQEVIYVVGGQGKVVIGNKEQDISEGTFMLIPPGTNHVLLNIDELEPLEVLVLKEDVLESSKDKAANIIIKDYRDLPVITEHWCHINRHLLSLSDGLSMIHKVIIIKLEPNTISEPHSHRPNSDEVWYVLKGQCVHWLGRDVCVQQKGEAVACIPSEAQHCLINHTEQPIQFFYFAHYGDK
jgi:mannose-6-phosphate isomerase-like protein (cupin superfamily)